MLWLICPSTCVVDSKRKALAVSWQYLLAVLPTSGDWASLGLSGWRLHQTLGHTWSFQRCHETPGKAPWTESNHYVSVSNVCCLTLNKRKPRNPALSKPQAWSQISAVMLFQRHHTEHKKQYLCTQRPLQKQLIDRMPVNLTPIVKCSRLHLYDQDTIIAPFEM